MSDLEETRNELDDITRLLTRSSAEAFKFKSEIMGINKFVSGKNYEILSRFLSGTGAWKVLNKAKATVLTMVQLMDKTERASMAEAKRFQALTRALDEREKLKAVSEALKNDSTDLLRDAFKHYDAYVELKGGEVEANKQLTKEIKKQLEIQEGIIGAASDNRSMLGKVRDLFSVNVAGGTKQNKSAILLRDAIEKSSVFQAAVLTGGFTLSHRHLQKLITVGQKAAKIKKDEEEFKEKYGMETTEDGLVKLTNENMAAFEAMQDIENRKTELEEETRGILKTMGMKIGDIKEGQIDFLMKTLTEPHQYSEGEQKFIDFLTGLRLIPEYKDSGTKEMFPAATRKLNKFFTVFNRLNVAKGLIEMKKGVGQFIRNIPKNIGKGITGFFKGMKKIFLLVGKFMLTFTLIVTGIFFLYRGFKLIEKPLKEGFETFSNTFKFFMGAISVGFEFLKGGLDSIIEGFKTGNFFLVLRGIGEIWVGLLLVTLSAFVGLILSALAGLGKTLYSMFTQGENLTQNIVKGINALLYIGAGIAIVAGAIFSLPLLVAGAVLGGIAILIDSITPFASGGITSQGLQMVGEKGPELVKLPRGSRVYSNSDSAKMLSNGRTTNNITIQVTGRVGASDSEIKDIANKLSREMNNRMNRTGSAVSGF